MTTAEDVREGAALAEEVSRLTGIPVACHAAESRFREAADVQHPPDRPVLQQGVELRREGGHVRVRQGLGRGDEPGAKNKKALDSLCNLV